MINLFSIIINPSHANTFKEKYYFCEQFYKIIFLQEIVIKWMSYLRAIGQADNVCPFSLGKIKAFLGMVLARLWKPFDFVGFHC